MGSEMCIRDRGMQRDKSAATGIFTVYAGKKAEKYRITDLFDIFVKCKLT